MSIEKCTIIVVVTVTRSTRTARAGKFYRASSGRHVARARRRRVTLNKPRVTEQPAATGVSRLSRTSGLRGRDNEAAHMLYSGVVLLRK